MMALSTSMTVVVIHMHHRGRLGYRVPPWMRVIILHGLGRAMCMTETIKDNPSKEVTSKMNQVSSKSL